MSASGAAAAALFDVDGTLVDSNDAHARAWVDAFAEAGQDVPFERVLPLIGMGGDKLLPRAAGLSAESPAGRAIADRRGAIFREKYVAQLKPFPDARALLLALKTRGLRLAVASSADVKDLEALLRVAEASDLLEGRTSSDDAQSSKPDPDIVVAALAKLECAADQAILVGDTPYDVEAAQQAGVRCVGFRSGGWRDADLAGAVAIYDGPADLLARLESSPIFRH